MVNDKNNPRFAQAKADEVEKLVKAGTFEIVAESQVRKKGTVFQSRFVLAINNNGEKNEYFKARLVIFGHVDPEKPRVVNEAPTLLKISVRLMLSLLLAHSFPIWSRYINVAFIPSELLEAKQFLKSLEHLKLLSHSTVLQNHLYTSGRRSETGVSTIYA